MWLRGHESLGRDRTSWKCVLTHPGYSSQYFPCNNDYTLNHFKIVIKAAENYSPVKWTNIPDYYVKGPFFVSVTLASFRLSTRGRTWSTDEGDVIDGYVSRLSSNGSVQNHLVDCLQGHMDLRQLPLVPLISWFLPHLQERQEAESLVTMRMWRDFCNTVVCTETVQLALTKQCIYVILQSTFHNFVKSIKVERKLSKNSKKFLN